MEFHGSYLKGNPSSKRLYFYNSINSIRISVNFIDLLTRINGRRAGWVLSTMPSIHVAELLWLTQMYSISGFQPCIVFPQGKIPLNSLTSFDIVLIMCR